MEVDGGGSQGALDFLLMCLELGTGDSGIGAPFLTFLMHTQAQ